MYYFTNVWFAAFVPLTFVIINYLSYKKGIIKVMERDKQDGLGTVYYAISLLILTIISFGIFKKPSLGLIPTLVMAYGDGLAAVIGKLIKSNEEYLFIFDLNSSEMYERKIEEGSSKSVSSRTPIFPAEWKNQFGIPVAEHKKQLQINLFNDYAVFGLNDKAETNNNLNTQLAGDIKHE